MADRRRFPIDPVLRQTFLRCDEPPAEEHSNNGFTIRTAADYLGVTSRSIQRLRNTGLTARTADRYAQTLGMHPADLWPTWYHDEDI